VAASPDTEDQRWDGGNRPVSPFAFSLVLGLIAASITGSLPGGFSFGAGFFAGLALSLLAIYGSALIVNYMLRSQQGRDGVPEEARSQRKQTWEMSRMDNGETKQNGQNSAPPPQTKPWSFFLVLGAILCVTAIFLVVWLAPPPRCSPRVVKSSQP
jgi:hypothetical protein